MSEVTIKELKAMPFVTVEQMDRFREAALLIIDRVTKTNFEQMAAYLNEAAEQELRITTLQQRCEELEHTNSYLLKDRKTDADTIAGLRQRLAALEAGREVEHEVLLEHSGCGYGIQVNQITVRLERDEQIIKVRKGARAAAVPAPVQEKDNG